MAALQVVAQTPRRPDHDVRAPGEPALLAADVHAADAGDHPRAGVRVEPRQLTLHLERQFARRRHDEPERRPGRVEAPGIAAQVRSDREAIGQGLARASLRRGEQVSAGGARLEHGRLDRRRLGIAAFGYGTEQIGIGGREGHVRTIERAAGERKRHPPEIT
jgi:hypothetical protein